MRPNSLFMRHLFRHKWEYLLGTFLLSISCLLQLLIPRFLQYFADSIETMTINQNSVIELAIYIIFVGFGIAFFRSYSRIYIFQLSRSLEKRLRKKLFSHWVTLPSSYYNKHRIGDLMAHAINDVNVVRDVAMGGVFMSIELVILLSVAIIAMGATINFWLTLLILLPLPGLSFLAYKFRKDIYERSTKVQEAISRLTSKVQEFCAGIRVVKSYGQEIEELKKFEVVNQENVYANNRLIQKNSLFTAVSIGIVGLSYLLSFFFGGMMVMNNVITIGEFVAFNTYLSLIIAPVENLGKVIYILQRGFASDIRLQKILSTEAEIRDEKDVKPNINMNGTIEFKNLSFSYPDSAEMALQNINLTIPKGSSLAIVGRVGSGKTTLMNLLLRLYNPPRSTIFINGFDIHQIPLNQLRKSIGIVPQENFLFSTTITENIAFDPMNYTTNQIIEAAQLAQVYDNIIEFPKQFETALGERGLSLSGGQRQRISIARALIKSTSILIFDDSLSAVDAQTEEKILKGLSQKMNGQTSIIISHRISTIQKADQIIVLDHGRIIEKGTHFSLIKQYGVYRKMYEQQMVDPEVIQQEKFFYKKFQINVKEKKNEHT